MAADLRLMVLRNVDMMYEQCPTPARAEQVAMTREVTLPTYAGNTGLLTGGVGQPSCAAMQTASQGIHFSILIARGSEDSDP